MALGDLSDPAAVFEAIREFDQFGREAFLKKYGFGRARRYFLLYRGMRYDSKALVGAAHGFQFPSVGALLPEEFSGGEDTVAKKLRALGFEMASGEHLDSSQQYWAFCANPRRYRIREAVRHCETDFWTIGRSQPRAGDMAVIWQTLNSDGNRGIVAFAQIDGNPSVRKDDDNPYWVDRSDGDTAQARVPVSYVHSEKLPLWVDHSEAGSLLKSLSVARAQGGTIFSVSNEQWQALMDLVRIEFPTIDEREAATRPKPSRSKGQGPGLTQQERVAVEQHAMQRARDYLLTAWDTVQDVSANMSFDLLCQCGQESLRVEVKGTTSLGERIVLTRNEVRESAQPKYALFLCSEIGLNQAEPDKPIAFGGVDRFFDEFRAEDHRIEPISYTCRLDLTSGEIIN